jgi:hypothetical protein
MAHFAEIDTNNTVKQVIVVANAELLDNGTESEAKGIAFCQSIFGGTWVQTSFNGSIRKNFAGVGYTYNKDKDAFIAPRPYNSWTLDEATCRWQAPTPMPTDGKFYYWSEDDLSWREITNE